MGQGGWSGGRTRQAECTGLARSRLIVRGPLLLTSNTAPPNSQMAATTIACFIVSALAPADGKGVGKGEGLRRQEGGTAGAAQIV